MRFFYTIILLSLYSFCWSQTYTKVSYKLKKPVGNLEESQHTLSFDKENSIFYLNYKKFSTKIKREGASIVHPSNTIDSIANKKRYIFYDKKNEIFYTNMINNDREYIVKKAVENIKWEPTNQYKTILKHKCRKATATISGIEYTIWYSTKDTNAYGPLMLGGFDGLVLELESKYMHLIADKIEIVQGNLPKNYDFSKALTQEQYKQQLEKETKEKYNMEFRTEKN